MSERASRSQDRLMPVVESIPLFAGLDARELQRICDASRTQRVDAGALVVERGEPALALYAVALGRLKVVAPRSGGRDATLHILGPGDVFGEAAFFAAEGRTARITALEESVLLVLDRRAFTDLLDRSPLVCQRIIALLAERLRNTIDHFDATTSLEVPQRLARKLLLLVEHFGVPNGDGIGLSIKLSQTDLGELIDSSRQTVNKQLRAFSDAGILRVDGGQLVILDLQALKDAAANHSPSA